NWIMIGIGIFLGGVSFLIFSNKNNQNEVLENKIPIYENKSSNLCIECGKYFENIPKFFPNCGKPTKFNNQEEKIN
ncbi:MAG: hypothetical protein ACK4IX_03205, partial [Candidatus Sericytochromatia bacterium]